MRLAGYPRLIRLAVALAVVAAAVALPPPQPAHAVLITDCDGNDWGGANVTIDTAGSLLGGQHFNIGTFTVNTGITLSVCNTGDGGDGTLTVSADTIVITGDIDGSSRGSAGGAGNSAAAGSDGTGGGGGGGASAGSAGGAYGSTGDKLLQEGSGGAGGGGAVTGSGTGGTGGAGGARLRLLTSTASSGTLSGAGTITMNGASGSTGTPGASTVTILDNWFADETYAIQDLDPTISSGSNRLFLVQITDESNDTGAMDINVVSLGSTALTEIAEVRVPAAPASAAYHNIVWFGYLNEAGIAGTGATDTVTWTWNTASNATFGESKIAVATYQNVDQTTPIGVQFSTGLNATATSIVTDASITAAAGDKIVYADVAGQPGTHTAPTGYTEHVEEGITANDHTMATASRDATTATTETVTASWSLSTRLAIIAAVLNEAGTAAGGGGGGSGGGIFFRASTVNFTGTLNANGANGGGRIKCQGQTLTNCGNTRTASAGSAGTGFSGGSNGAAGTAGTITDFTETPPTAVTLSSLNAHFDAGQGIVRWETSTEFDTVGFNILRSPSVDGPFERINADLLPARYPGSILGGDYSFTDDTVLPGQPYLYKVQEVDLEGRAIEEYGPFAIAGAGITSDSVERVQPQAVPLESVSAGPPEQAAEQTGKADRSTRSDWASPAVMRGIGGALLGLALAAAWVALRRGRHTHAP